MPVPRMLRARAGTIKVGCQNFRFRSTLTTPVSHVHRLWAGGRSWQRSAACIRGRDGWERLGRLRAPAWTLFAPGARRHTGQHVVTIAQVAVGMGCSLGARDFVRLT